MNECPDCGYVDALCWHYPTYHGLEMPYAKIEELRQEQPEIAKAVEAGKVLRKNVLEAIVGHYAYKYNAKSGYVRRRWLTLWKIAKWGQIPMEKYKHPIKGKQKLLLGTSVTSVSAQEATP